MPMYRRFLFSLFAFAWILVAEAAGGPPPTVEIVAMGHPPVRAALAPLRAWLAQQGSKVAVREIDIESSEGLDRLKKAGLSGHVPMLILVDGKHAFRRKDGTTVDFINFPNIPDSPPGIRGNWVAADVEAIVINRRSFMP
jgi:hypothetical protein